MEILLPQSFTGKEAMADRSACIADFIVSLAIWLVICPTFDAPVHQMIIRLLPSAQQVSAIRFLLYFR
jgi:hypothetical protein